MSDRRLVVAELDPTDPHNGELFAISPNNATGISLPTFRIGTTLPTVGNTVGESFYEQSTKKAFVWSGAAWREIAASPVKRFADRTALLADTVEPVGTFAVTADTGEVYIKQATGWAFIGIKEYATAALLLADTVQTGAIATALDEGSLWQKQTNGWRCLTIRELANLAAVQAWVGTPAQGVHAGDTAMALDNELSYVRTSAGWRPQSLWEETEANIRAASWPINGQEAISTDTGRTFVRIGGAWIEEPIQHYATEALLLAATPPNGTLSWADDTNVVFTRAGGAWHRLQGPQISVGATAPSTPGAGDQWFDTSANRGYLNIYTGSAWVGTNGTTVNKAGTAAVLPGYFSKDPSATNTSSDTGGLAFRYYGTESRLFITKGGIWNPITPEVGKPANEDKFVRADAHGNPVWSYHGAMQVMHSADNTGNANQMVHEVSQLATRAFRQHGSFSPKQNFCYPKLVGIHKGNWMNWGSAVVFEGSFMIRWKDGGASREDLRAASDGNGGLLVYGDDSYAVGQHSPCPFEIKILGFGVQGTNDYCQIVYRLGPYKNKNNDWLTVDGTYRMGADFDPAQIERFGIKFDDHGNKGPVSLTTEFF